MMSQLLSCSAALQTVKLGRLSSLLACNAALEQQVLEGCDAVSWTGAAAADAEPSSSLA